MKPQLRTNPIPLLFICLSLLSTPATAKKFTVAYSQPDTAPVQIWLHLIYEELLNRVGFKAEMVRYPFARMAFELDQGHVDADVGRVFEYQQAHPTQVRVEEPLYSIDFLAYTRLEAGDDAYLSWEDLSVKALRIGYTRGTFILQQNLTQNVTHAEISDVTHTTQGFQMLAAKRIDVFIDDHTVGLAFLRSDEFKNKIKTSGKLISIPIYPYIAQKHQQLAPAMARALKRMKEEGLVKQFCIQAFGVSATTLCNTPK